MKLIRKKKDDDESLERTKVKLSPWKILVVDDEPDIHAITRLNLKNFTFADKQLEFLQATSAKEAKELLLREPDIAVALIDVVMETDDAGLQLVEFIRNELGNTMVRLIIRTGQPGVAPERLVVDRYDIDDYKDKTELTVQKLYTTMRSALKSFRDLSTINVNRKGLEKILDAASELYRPQSVNNFFDGVLTQIIGLCNLGENSLISTVNSGLIITSSEERVVIQAGTGRFADIANDHELQQIVKNCSDSILGGKTNEQLPPNMMPIPLKVREETMGFVCLENVHYLTEADHRLINIMAHQCASALKNLSLYIDLKEANRQALYMLAVAAEYKDKDTGDHINRLANYTIQLAKEVGFSKEEAESYGQASMLHDIGKVGIPDAILKKPGKLTEEEFQVIKTHSQLGAEILGKNKWFTLAYHIAYGHHERWDGRGYPRGISGEQIHPGARIVAVADVFDALTHIRCYKEAWPTGKAIAEIEQNSGKQFDPTVVQALISLHQRGELAL